MGRNDKILTEVLRGTSDQNIAFRDLCRLAQALGFEERIKGSHRVYTRDDVVEILNFQPRSRDQAKPYQVKQFRQIITKYRLELP